MPPNRIVELASLIRDHTGKVDDYLVSQKLPSPSFDVSSPARLSLPPEIQDSKDAVLEASDELNALMLGPMVYIASQPHNIMISLQAIQRFEIAKTFPLNSTASFAEIARACSLPEPDTRRILRHAMTYYVFSEPSKGIVAHTAASKVLAETPLLCDLVGFLSGEMWPSATRVVDAMERWPGSEEPNQTGFSIAHNTDRPMMDVVGEDSERAKRMAGAMSLTHAGPGYSVEHVLNNVDWGEAECGSFVDVGGSLGTVTIEIARHFPMMRCVVQDLPEVIAGAKVPADLQERERLKFMAHDFFTEQPIKGADVYFLRWILHDWSDKYAIMILRNLVPALKQGARVLVSDLCLLPPCVLSPFKERPARAFDLSMKEIQNAKERDADDWKQLFENADPRFKFCGVTKPPLSNLAIMAVSWQDEMLIKASIDST